MIFGSRLTDHLGYCKYHCQKEKCNYTDKKYCNDYNIYNKLMLYEDLDHAGELQILIKKGNGKI